jgi:vitamin B12 transporter
MNKIKIRISAAVFSLFATSVVAQEKFELDEIIISGGNSPIKAADLATSNSVITSEDIKQHGDVTIQSLLRQIPGVAVNSTGSSFTEIRIRGGEANHTLVLIDGVPATGGDGNYIFSGLSATEVERIEILRGPQTIFFGPSASSGVINIITKSPDKNGGVFSGSVGSTLAAAVSQNFKLGRASSNVTIVKEDYEGYDQSYSNGDKDGFNRETFQIKTKAVTDSGIEMTLKFRNAAEKYDTDEVNSSATSHLDYLVDTNDEGKRDEVQTSLNLQKSSSSGKSKHSFLIAHTKYSNSLNGIQSADNDQELIKYHFQQSLEEKPLRNTAKSVSIVLDHHNDQNQMNKAQKRRGTAIAFEYRQKFQNDSALQLGSRIENGNRFKTAVTWKVGYVLPLITNSTSLLFDAGTAVVNPTYGEIFGSAWVNGNSNLKPEKNVSVSVGLKQDFTNQKNYIKAVVFRDKLTSEISYDTASPSNVYNEVGNSKRKGLELDIQFQPLPQTIISGNYSYLIAKNPDGSVEARRPKHSLNSQIEYQFAESKGRVALSATRIVKNYDSYSVSPWASRKLPDYTKFDLKGSFNIKSNFSITGQISNLFDKEYSDSWGYRGAGRSYYLTAATKW